MHPDGLRAHPGSLGSLGCTLGFVGLIRGRWVHSCAPKGSLGSFGCALGVVVYICGRWGPPLCSLALTGFIGFAGVRPAVRWFHLGENWECLSSSRVVGFTRVRTWGR